MSDANDLITFMHSSYGRGSLFPATFKSPSSRLRDMMAARLVTLSLLLPALSAAVGFLHRVRDRQPMAATMSRPSTENCTLLWFDQASHDIITSTPSPDAIQDARPLQSIEFADVFAACLRARRRVWRRRIARFLLCWQRRRRLPLRRPYRVDVGECSKVWFDVFVPSVCVMMMF